MSLENRDICYYMYNRSNHIIIIIDMYILYIGNIGLGEGYNIEVLRGARQGTERGSIAVVCFRLTQRHKFNIIFNVDK